MASARRKWRLHWVDGVSFKVEQEADNLTDRSMEEWGHWMDSQFEKRFGDSRPRLTAATLNFSRNDLGDEGVRIVVEYLRKREISVQMLKFFDNGVGDAGAWSIGQLLAHSPDPVQEVHLSHNRISEQGACSIFEAIARSRRYPFPSDRAGRRDPRGLTPMWLRMEFNCINWSAIEHRLEQQGVRWCAAESRDKWAPKDSAPMVCMHQSYRKQKGQGLALDAELSSMLLRTAEGRSREVEKAEAVVLAALRGDGKATSNGHASPVAAAPAASQEAGPVEEVPMYVFLDASAVRRMMSRQDSLFTFQGLLNLCQQGHMKCTPPEDQRTESWMKPAEERDRIILVVTDSVLDELAEMAEQNASEKKRIEWLRTASDSYLQLGHAWGILEMLETKLHTQLMKLPVSFEQRARDLKISQRTLKMFDFASLWESQIDSDGRVIFVTGEEAMKRLGAEANKGLTKRVPVVKVDELDRRFALDRERGGAKLCEAALRQKASKFCGAVLSADVFSTVVLAVESAAAAAGAPTAATPEPRDGAGPEAAELRRELKEAMTLLSSARQLLDGAYKTNGKTPDPGAEKVAQCFARIDAAQRRWRALLARRR